MTSLLTAFLILVPAPSSDEMPTGGAPTLQYVKLVNGALEMNVFIKEQVPFTQAIMVVNNGIVETRNVTSIREVTKIVRQNISANGADFYTVDGKKLDDVAFKKSLGSGGVIAIASDGKLPHPAFLKVLREGTLIMVAKPTPPMVPDVPKD